MIFFGEGEDAAINPGYLMLQPNASLLYTICDADIGGACSRNKIFTSEPIPTPANLIMIAAIRGKLFWRSKSDSTAPWQAHGSLC